MDTEIVNLDAQCSSSPSKTLQTTQKRGLISDSSKLRLLKTLRNPYTPISKLPDEILLEIFTIADIPDIIAHTCQHWRLLAVGTPTLWTDLPTCHHDHALRFLERSRNIPFNVSIWGGTASTTASAIMENIERIRKLHVRQSAEYLSNMQMVGRIAPHLEDLSILNWSGDRTTFTFSPDAFGITTKLRKLKLADVCFHWCILLALPALTHLHLQKVTVTHRVTGTKFTNTLRGLPLLQVLYISFADIKLHEYSKATLFEPIHLPHLTTLDIPLGSNRHHIDHFFSHATLPRLRTLRVDYGCDSVDHSPMVRTLASTIQNGDCHPLEYLGISSDTLKITSLPCDRRHGPYIEIHMPVARVGGHRDDFAMATEIRSCVTPNRSRDFSALVRLSIASLRLTSDEWRQLFGGLPYLECVDIYWGFAAFFIEALTIPLNQHPDSPIFFPRLDSIEWCGHYFHELPCPDPEFLSALIDCLMQRCEYGVPIHNLVLKCSNLAADTIEAKLLREIVVNVVISSR